MPRSYLHRLTRHSRALSLPLLFVPVTKVLTNIDDINAVAVAAYTALQQQSTSKSQPAAGAVRHLQQAGSGFVPLSSLQAIFDAVSKVITNCCCHLVHRSTATAV